MTRPVVLFADRMPPLLGGMEQHAGAFVEHFAGHPGYPLAAVVIEGLDAPDAPLLFFNSGRWIEDLAELRARRPRARFVYRTGGNEILKAPLERRDLPGHRDRQAWWAETLNATIDLLITNSAFTEARLRALGVRCRFARCVGGVRTVAGVARATGPPTLFCAARFVPYKNHQRLLDLLALLVARGHEPRLRLAGDGPLLARCRAHAERLALGPHVTFLGPLDNEAVCRETAAADFYVQLSVDTVTPVPGGQYLHAEGMGRSILEAVSAGTYVIAGASGALAEVVGPERGLLVDLSGSDASIADAVAPLLRSVPRPPPTDEYAWARVFGRYERLWEDLLAAPRRH